MISRALFTARTNKLAMLLAPASQLATTQSGMPYMSVRGFAKKKRGRKSPDLSDFEEDLSPQEDLGHVEATPEPTPEPVAEPVKPVQAAPVSRDLFTPFSVGDIKVVASVEDNKALSKEDTIEGRYAGVLFTTASQNEDLYNVYEDMQYLRELYKNCEEFRLFTENGGVGAKEVAQLCVGLKECAPFCDTTMKFIQVLGENSRLVFIKEIADRYSKLYAEVNKEEKVTIISATELTADQRSEILAALKANPQNEGKEFTVVYEIDDTIMGGLQMYTESEFMDMSLASRVTRINQEIEKLSM